MTYVRRLYFSDKELLDEIYFTSKDNLTVKKNGIVYKIIKYRSNCPILLDRNYKVFKKRTDTTSDHISSFCEISLVTV